DASTKSLTPSNSTQETMASPRGPIATDVSLTEFALSETGCGGLQVVEPGDRVDTSTWDFDPISRNQTATALPFGSTSTCSLKESNPSAERSCGRLQSPPAGRTAPCTSE